MPQWRQALLRQLLYDVCQRALNRRLAGLDLPAAEVCAVIGDGQLEIVHGGLFLHSRAPRRPYGVPDLATSVALTGSSNRGRSGRSFE